MRFSTEEEWRNYIYSSYVRRLIERRPTGDPGYTDLQILSWLRNLACYMSGRGLKEFLIEEPQLSVLQGSRMLFLYMILSRVCVWSLFVASLTFVLWIESISPQARLNSSQPVGIDHLVTQAITLLLIGLTLGVASYLRSRLPPLGSTTVVEAVSHVLQSRSMLMTMVGVMLAFGSATALGSLPAQRPETPWLEAIKGIILVPWFFVVWRALGSYFGASKHLR